MKQNDLSMIGALPLPSTWLQCIGAYQSDDARIVRASISMLFAAFHGRPCGTIENTLPSIAAAAQLPLDVAQSHLPLLKAGYRETKTRLVFDPMAEMAARLHTEYSAQLQVLHDRVVLQLASPTLFDPDTPVQESELNQIGGATRAKAQNHLDRQTKVAQPLPYDAQMTDAMRDHCDRRGFHLSQYDDIWQRFRDYAHSSRRTYVDWNAAFRTWMDKNISWGNLVPRGSNAVSTQMANSIPATRPAFAYANPAEQRKQSAKEISRQRMMKTQAFVSGEQP